MAGLSTWLYSAPDLRKRLVSLRRKGTVWSRFQNAFDPSNYFPNRVIATWYWKWKSVHTSPSVDQPLFSDFRWWNVNISCTPRTASQWELLSPSKRSVYPASASPWVCRFDTRDLLITVYGKCETDSGVQVTGVVIQATSTQYCADSCQLKGGYVDWIFFFHLLHDDFQPLANLLWWHDLELRHRWLPNDTYYGTKLATTTELLILWHQ